MIIRRLEETETDTLALNALLGALSERDMTVIAQAVNHAPARQESSKLANLQWVAVGKDGSLQGYAAIEQLPGWSDHVGELRLVVAPASRGNGLGRRLTQRAVIDGQRAGMSKIVVELAADDEPVLTMFSELGFTGEALLRDHIRDYTGNLCDLIVLALHADEAWATLSSIGAEELV